MPSFKEYDPAKDIPDLSGKVILVTGGTAGLGEEIVVQLAAHNPAKIYLTGRNAKAGEEVVKEAQAVNSQTKVAFLPCDLASLAAVQEAGKKVLSENDRLDILYCNAGIMALPPGLTKDGFELQFGTNHVGHALLIKMLLPMLLKTAETNDVRVVITSSQGYAGASGIDFDTLNTPQKYGVDFFGRWMRYAQSKLANILYAQQLAAHYPQLTALSVHPGIIMTNLVSNTALADRMLVASTTFWRQSTVQDGAKNGLWAGTVKDKPTNGGYYEPVGNVGGTTKASKNEALAKQLWEWTEQTLSSWS